MTAPAPISATVTGHGDAWLPRAYLWLAAASGALGGLLFGYDWVVIGGAKPFYEIFFHLTSPELQGWAMSCALLGCLAGAAAAGSLSDRFGRKRLLTLAALTFAASSLGDALAAQFIVFVAWRIVGGFAIGLASGVSPMYIAEISPAHLRGRLVSLNQLAIVIGILLAQVVNWLIARPVSAAAPAEILLSWNGQQAWRWMFGVTAVPSVLFLIATFLLPESPRWLASRGRNQQALKILTRLGGESYARHVMDDFRQVSGEPGSISLFRELAHPGVARALVLGLVLGVLYRLRFQGALMLALVLAAIACYAVSLAPVTWVVISEIFPNRIRAGAVSLAVTALWTACFALTYTFPLLNAAIGAAGAFFLYAAICLAGLVYLFLRLPETRNRTLEEIETSLRGAE